MPQSQKFDFVIVGAGMAGASCAYFLSAMGSVLILEMEDQPGYHTTGRSAALFAPSYGNAQIRALSVGGQPFLDNPPDNFSETPLLTPRGALFIGRENQIGALDKLYDDISPRQVTVSRLCAAEVCELVPVIRPDYVAGGILDNGSQDMDVNALHQGFLRGARAKGAKLVSDAAVTSLTKAEGDWKVRAGGEVYTAAVVVNAAGAWCDKLADLAGAKRIGLQPKRRTGIIFDGPEDMRFSHWPAFIDIDEEFYARPESGGLMGSPADETPMEPCDVQPEELDIAIAIDRLQQATTLEIKRVIRSWAGLRSFVADKTPVVGFDPQVQGFFWLAGQGGYGIQTAPSMGRVSAALASGGDLPEDLKTRGVSTTELSPKRFV
ncbi:FAD-binding oxidoreductase [Sneathiella marina]|uniref:FAD-binding oxidoreductase n=1 Tax=Sneathiella marina TaxID=2950108 RepID=A0ABY4W1L5_9PROT|nr:FAD-dependent oxidoreductase [Sneathiella marina]USG61100.1 FAD-binding oxidoreductase [Sneathiella marina]